MINNVVYLVDKYKLYSVFTPRLLLDYSSITLTGDDIQKPDMRILMSGKKDDLYCLVLETSD